MAISMVLVRSLVDAVNRRGHDVDRFLELAGLDRSLLDNPEYRLEMSEYDRLQELALEVTGDAALGLHMGENASPTTFGVVGQLAANSRTLRDALDVLVRYYPLIIDFTPPTLSTNGAETSLIYPFAHSSPRLTRLCAEFGMTRFALFGRSFAGPVASLVNVWFEHEKPAYGDEYTRIFGERVAFGMPHTGLVFPTAVLDIPQLHWDQELHRLLIVQAERALHRAENRRAEDRLLALLRSNQAWVRPDMREAARMLGLTVRSLRRRLASEGKTFRQLIDAVQRERALLMVRNPAHSVESISSSLGFSEVSAFHRAFRRWTGLTPHQYRYHPDAHLTTAFQVA